MLIKMIRDEHQDKDTSCMRVLKYCFDVFLSYIRDDIQKKDTTSRAAIPPEQRLAVTLMYLATGDSWKSLAILFRMGESTILRVVYEVCAAIWTRMGSKYLQTPSSIEEWKIISAEYV